MKPDLIAANLFRRDLNLDEKPFDRLPGYVSSRHSDVDPLQPTFEITMRFRNRCESMPFQNHADPRRIQAVHFVDANTKTNRQVLFLSKTCEQAVFCAAGSFVFVKHQ